MEIYDAYLEEIAKQEKLKDKKGAKSVGGDKTKEETKKSTGIELQVRKHNYTIDCSIVLYTCVILYHIYHMFVMHMHCVASNTFFSFL